MNEPVNNELSQQIADAIKSIKNISLSTELTQAEKEKAWENVLKKLEVNQPDHAKQIAEAILQDSHKGQTFACKWLANKIQDLIGSGNREDIKGRPPYNPYDQY